MFFTNFVYINQVNKEYRPQSENVKLFGENGLFEKDSLEVIWKAVPETIHSPGANTVILSR